MSSPKSQRSPKGKGSPKSKSSPKKSPKGNKSPKHDADEDEQPFVFVPPPRPPPPPDPPKGPLLSRLRRQVWYPYANRITFEKREWFWSPYCPVITSWGDIWVTDPPQRRILRYYFDPVSAKISLCSPNVIVRGEPRMMIEIPRTGRMAVLVTCPTAKKTMLVLYSPMELKEEAKIDFKYVAQEPPLPELPDLPVESESKRCVLEDDCTPIGLCANRDLLFVLFQPIQRIKLFEPAYLKPIDVRLENAYPDESTCVHLASSGGCAASEDKLFLACTRPPRVQVFWICRQMLLSKIDRVDLTWYAELGLDRLSIGEPFGVQVDSLGLVVVSDSRGGYMRVYNADDKRPPGPWLPSLPHGETCYLGSWKVDPYQHVRPGHFSLGKNGTACVVDRWANKLHLICDRTELRWYDETLLALDDALFIRPVVDPLMPVHGLPPPPVIDPFVVGDFRRTASQMSLEIPEDELLPEWLKKRYVKEEEIEAKTSSPKASPKGKKSPKDKKSPKSGSPKSKSSKSKKSK
ncbi:hypothetical protein CSKR_106149 [Clonorchis sinensis]|uniref:Uncharacterized protein n=1 Tax=Clonorchis sinensis TaxID=79923 RepID=A0A419PJI0_CLOSI|nr:hypothetical protein CSKR_106149 [Clonorchis sinensis]